MHYSGYSASIREGCAKRQGSVPSFLRRGATRGGGVVQIHEFALALDAIDLRPRRRRRPVSSHFPPGQACRPASMRAAHSSDAETSFEPTRAFTCNSVILYFTRNACIQLSHSNRLGPDTN